MSAWLQGNFSTVMKGNYEWLFLMIPLWFVIYLFAYHFTVVGMGEAFANSLGVHYREFSFRFDAGCFSKCHRFIDGGEYSVFRGCDS